MNLPRVEYVERRVLNEEESIKLLLACNAPPEGLVFEFAVMTGMRLQEYLALKWADLDFDRKSVMILRALEPVAIKDVKDRGKASYPAAIAIGRAAKATQA